MLGGGDDVSAAEGRAICSAIPAVGIVQVVPAPDDYYVEAPRLVQLKPDATATEEEIIAFCSGKIATFRVPRYVRFVTEWPMSGTRSSRHEDQEGHPARDDGRRAEGEGHHPAPKISAVPLG